MPDSSKTPTEQPAETPEPISVPSALAPQPAKTGPARRRRRLWLWLALLLVLGLGGYILWSKIAGAKSAAAAKAAAAKGPPPIPVVAATSRKGDIGVYYSGLGAVTPLATVTVKSRVDGQLMSARYREGDTVHKGDLLAEIDEGPYQAALTQAEGQLMRDQATLENARIDLVRLSTVGPAESHPGATACHPTGNRASGRGSGETR